MNEQHDWSISLTAIVRRQTAQKLALETQAIRDHRYTQLALRETLRGQYLIKLIDRQRENIENWKEATESLDSMRLMRRIRFNNEFIRRFIFTFNPALKFNREDVYNSHLLRCLQCTEYIDKICQRTYIPPDLNGECAHDIPKKFKELFDELVVEHLLLVGEEIEDFSTVA